MSQHLATDRLARLVDEAPTADEAAHLGTCARCRDELDGLGRQTRELGQLPDLEPPADGLAALRLRLEAEGLVSDVPMPAARSARARGLGAAWRAAAAIALLLIGAAAGAWLRGPAPAGTRAADEPVASVGQPPAAAHEPAGAVVRSPAAALDPAGAAIEPPTAAAPEQVARDVQLAEAAYLAALARYLEVAEPEELPDPVARLATLESIIVTTRAALNQAPSDPVINGYHLTAVAQRNATLDRLATLLGEPWF